MATERGFDRLVNFSDAIVAIAATLLVLPLVDLASAVTSGKVDQTITEGLPQFLIFVLSFLVVTRFWFSHHRFFERVKAYSPLLVGLNLMWLLGIVVMPFPTQLVAKASSSDHLAVAVYIGTMLWISIAQLLMSLELYRNPQLLRDGVHRAESVVVSAVLSASILIALIVGLIWPDAGLWSLALIAFVKPVTTAIMRRVDPADLDQNHAD